jgi:hypothetical protein
MNQGRNWSRQEKVMLPLLATVILIATPPVSASPNQLLCQGTGASIVIKNESYKFEGGNSPAAFTARYDLATSIASIDGQKLTVQDLGSQVLVSGSERSKYRNTYQALIINKADLSFVLIVHLIRHDLLGEEETTLPYTGKCSDMTSF